MVNKNIVIIGYSGHGFVLIDVALENQLKIVGYADKNEKLSNPFQLKYLGSEMKSDFFSKHESADYLIGIGDNYIRDNIYNRIIEEHGEILTLISQSAIISNSAIIGKGTFINKSVSINAFAKIGENVILNTACIIEHDCEVADSVHIAPGAVLAGNVTIGERSFIGANSVIKQGVTIGKDVVVGAGTVVLKNIYDGKKIVGNPSRYI